MLVVSAICFWTGRLAPSVLFCDGISGTVEEISVVVYVDVVEVDGKPSVPSIIISLSVPIARSELVRAKADTVRVDAELDYLRLIMVKYTAHRHYLNPGLVADIRYKYFIRYRCVESRVYRPGVERVVCIEPEAVAGIDSRILADRALA